MSAIYQKMFDVQGLITKTCGLVRHELTSSLEDKILFLIKAYQKIETGVEAASQSRGHRWQIITGFQIRPNSNDIGERSSYSSGEHSLKNTSGTQGKHHDMTNIAVIK